MPNLHIENTPSFACWLATISQSRHLLVLRSGLFQCQHGQMIVVVVKWGWGIATFEVSIP